MTERSTATTTAPRSVAGGAVAGGAARALPRPTIRHGRPVRVPEVVIGVLLVAGCALGALVWQRGNDRSVTIVVAARPIARGASIAADDLRGARVAGDTSGMITGDSAAALLGKIAVVPIRSGAPMSPSLLTERAPLAPDEALTSVAVDDGAMPPDLAVGDSVRVVVSRRSGGADTATTLLDGVAVVWSVDARSDTNPAVVTLRGQVGLAVDVTAATAVRLVRVVGS